MQAIAAIYFIAVVPAHHVGALCTLIAAMYLIRGASVTFLTTTVSFRPVANEILSAILPALWAVALYKGSDSRAIVLVSAAWLLVTAAQAIGGTTVKVWRVIRMMRGEIDEDGDDPSCPDCVETGLAHKAFLDAGRRGDDMDETGRALFEATARMYKAHGKEGP